MCNLPKPAHARPGQTGGGTGGCRGGEEGGGRSEGRDVLSCGVYGVTLRIHWRIGSPCTRWLAYRPPQNKVKVINKNVAAATTDRYKSVYSMSKAFHENRAVF